MTDISKNTVVTLIIIALVVSVVGSFIVSEKLSEVKAEVDGADTQDAAEVISLEVDNDDASEGNVGFTVINKG